MELVTGGEVTDKSSLIRPVARHSLKLFLEDSSSIESLKKGPTAKTMPEFSSSRSSREWVICMGRESHIATSRYFIKTVALCSLVLRN